jgi:hypothetical protein
MDKDYASLPMKFFGMDVKLSKPCKKGRVSHNPVFIARVEDLVKGKRSYLF